MLSLNKERKNGVATLVFEVFRKNNPLVFAVFHKYRGTIYIQENIFFNMYMYKTINTGFITNIYLSVKKQQIYFKKREQHDINKLFNGI